LTSTREIRDAPPALYLLAAAQVGLPNAAQRVAILHSYLMRHNNELGGGAVAPELLATSSGTRVVCVAMRACARAINMTVRMHVRMFVRANMLYFEHMCVDASKGLCACRACFGMQTRVSTQACVTRVHLGTHGKHVSIPTSEQTSPVRMGHT